MIRTFGSLAVSLGALRQLGRLPMLRLPADLRALLALRSALAAVARLPQGAFCLLLWNLCFHQGAVSESPLGAR